MSDSNIHRQVTLEFHDDAANSHKFYRVVIFKGDGGGTLSWGRIGTVGQVKSVGIAEAMNKLAEKTAKGYVVKYDSMADGKPNPTPKAEAKPFGEKFFAGKREPTFLEGLEEIAKAK